ncbi:4860_t:CDS:2 [Cetraspora pellucida]|uniref:4860_t:CDS:1 n=1 Tax=Cetraspora pellucida TaxID=1433469 RepID=A0A9N9FL82_9GLOM|nr:4860_t:CDS:2 [Cetraspora pellucida]
MYKICDDSIKPRQFLGTDSEDGIEAILIECQGHSLYEYIGGDGPLHSIINFDLSREKFDKIEPKLSSKEIQDLLCHAFSRTCKEIYPEWDSYTLTIASSSDKKKMLLHISTFGLRLKNIAKVAIFTKLVRKKLPVSLQSKDIVDNITNKNPFFLQMLGAPKFIEKTNKHVSVFDFMLHPPNDESSEVVSPLLVISEPASTKISNTCTKTTEDIEIELNLIAKLLEEFEIRGYELSKYGYKDPHTSDNAYVIRNKKSYSFYCHHANNNREAGFRKPSIKLTIKEKTSEQEESLAVSEKLNQPRIMDPNDHFVWGDLIDIGKKFWIFKVEDEDEDGGLIFEFVPKLELANYEINIVEFGGESIKLRSLIDRAVTKGLIRYRKINFLPYLPNTILLKTNFFNLFLGFTAKPALEIKKEIMDPILWHVKNKPHSICVLKSTLQQCEKNIIIDFIGNKVLGPKLYYATSDLGKIFGKFNSHIQGKKLVVMNETKRKGLEPIHLKDYSAFMVTSNQDALLKIDAEDACIVCFDVSACCRENILYFKRLAKILEHPDAPGIVMSYLLNHDLSNWDPQDIPSTKMKTDTILVHLPSPTRFIIDHISPWSKDRVEIQSRTIIYQEYQAWCEANGEKPFSNNILGKKFTHINIENKRAGVIEEFSDAPQPETLANESTDIPIFYDLFDSITNESLVASLSKSTDISLPPEIVYIELVDDKSEPVSEIIKPVNNKVESPEIIKLINDPEISPNLPVNNEPKTINEDPDKFITITEKDRNLARIYYDKMMADAEIIEFAQSNGVNPENYMELSRREKLICMEIDLRLYEDKGEF